MPRPYPKLVSVIPTLHGVVLAIFADERVFRVDFRDRWSSPAFQPLQDPEEFEAVRLVAGGGGIEWPCGADMSALAIEAAGTPVRTRITPPAALPHSADAGPRSTSPVRS